MKNDYYEVSFFELIENFSSEVKEYVISILKSLASCSTNSTDHLFLCWLFESLPFKLIEDTEDFINFSIGILLGSYPQRIENPYCKDTIFVP
jgi:hypothetical protein